MPVNTELATKIWYRYQYCRDNGHTGFVKKARVCEDFFRGKQWSEDDLAKLRQSRRPALTINKIISTISNVMGEQIFNRAEVSFRPRNNAPTGIAETLNKVYQQIADMNQLNWKRSDMFADGIITSRGFLDVRMDYSGSIQGDVKIDLLNPKNVVIDPDAEDYDPDTWNEVYTTKWLTIDDIELLYGKDDADALRAKGGSTFAHGYDAIDEIKDKFGADNVPVAESGAFGDFLKNVLRNYRVIERQYRVLDRQMHFIYPRTGECRPVPEGWNKQKMNQVAKQFGLEVIPKLVKRIKWTIVCDNVVLHDDWSPYNHFTVVPYFPYFRRGDTIGLVENLIGPQELLNKISSQELHVVNTTANSGWKVKAGALTNMSVEELEARGAETGLVIEVNGDPEKDVTKINPNQVPQGLDRISYKAEEHIKTISNVPDSVMGQDRADVAAKAIQQKRAAASTNQAKPMDSLARTDWMLARTILNMVQEFYTEERIMTIISDQATGATEQVTLNQVTQDDNGIVEILNDMTVGEYDVVITSVPARETLEDSQFEQAISMREMGVMIPDEVLIMASRLQNKKDILEKMNAGQNTPEAQAAAAAQQRAAEAEAAKMEAETASKQADAQLKQAKAQKETITAERLTMEPIGDQGNQNAEQEFQLEVMKTQQEMELEERKFQHEVMMDQRKLQHEQQMARLKAQQDAQAAAQDRAMRIQQQSKQPQRPQQ